MSKIKGPETIKLSSPETHEFWEIPILFEDDQLLVIDKPASLRDAPDAVDPLLPDLMKLLHRDIARGAAWATRNNRNFLSNPHRLDHETSGALVLAKSKEAHADLANQFGSNKPQRVYMAIVTGAPPEDQWTIDAKLAPDPLRPGLTRIELREGKKAVTHFETVTRFRGWALVRCLPETERFHQIRVHLRWSKLPLASDSVYGGTTLFLSAIKRAYHEKKGQEERPLIGRAALHCESVELVHPGTQQPLTVQAPWANDFDVAVKYLRKFAGL